LILDGIWFLEGSLKGAKKSPIGGVVCSLVPGLFLVGGVFDENNIWGPGRTQWRDEFSVFECHNDTVEIWTERLYAQESTLMKLPLKYFSLPWASSLVRHIWCPGMC
jgi:hypothetical protein